jgi:hypothetical protein
MKKLISLLVLIGMIVSCTNTRKAPEQTANTNSTSIKTETDGSSYQNAIVLNETSESAGVDAEYAWLKKNYAGYTLIKQSLSEQNGKSYDILNIKTPHSGKKSIYFDISNFFGKF